MYMHYDINEIGEIEYSWNFDQEEYNEWLEEEELTHSEETFNDYIKDYVEFNLELFDNETFHHMSYDYCDLSELEDNYGENIASEILRGCIENGGGRLETANVLSQEIDINDPKQISDQAKKLFNTRPYIKGDRGFILKDGTFIHTEAEHNMCSAIYGIKGTFHFISLGNIRVLDHSLDISQEPTNEQYAVLRTILASYSGEELYLDLDKHSIQFREISPLNVLNQIRRYFSEGIVPYETMYESFKKKDIIRILKETLKKRTR